MWKKLLLAAAALAAATCVGDGVEGMAGSLPTEESPTDQTPSIALRMRDESQQMAKPCDVLPSDDEACAHACEPDALLAYIPAGTCASFACPMRDGSYFITGGCNY